MTPKVLNLLKKNTKNTIADQINFNRFRSHRKVEKAFQEAKVLLHILAHHRILEFLI